MKTIKLFLSDTIFVGDSHQHGGFFVCLV